MNTTRRQTLQAACAAAFAAALPARQARAAVTHFDPQPGPWRTFEVTMNVSVADAQGRTQLWLPMPDVETGFQRTLSQDWQASPGAAVGIVSAEGVRMVHADFPASVKQPQLSLTSRVQTRGRKVDWSQPGRASEDPEVLKANLVATELVPVDGIVLKTAQQAIGKARTDIDKTRAIYRWLVTNAHREPSVRGCGTGDVRTMLETGNLGGKCADLNAIFVGLCRSVGVPARDLYGLRVSPSAFGYRELGGNPASLKGAQHCRAEVYLKAYGWVAMDPADVLKVMRQETPEWIKDASNPLIAPVDKALFGGWEGNWIAYNTGHDITLPGAAGKASLPFLMYPQGENASGRFDELSPDTFKYTISSRELTT
ncbi:transglutaminase-like domain-containing protein [Pelomonas sp. KK5]|uniref:transglutaminase-like domain-containing protein n=1 Tax=Pelomonas sp. KK5 TaxID=1855730 RepID=UPI00097CAC68|nr:transglutaminase domain-containing protein [Pelomonas sp. KK5]